MKLLKKMLLQENSPPKRKQNYHHLTIFKPYSIMKTIKLFFIATILFTLSANAQITKGNWMVGGSGNFTNYKSTIENNNTETTQTGSALTIAPNLGYFVVENVALGTIVSFSFSNPSGDNNNSQGYGVSPFIRYYFRKSDKMINPFLQTSYNFSEGKSDSGGTNKSTGYTIKGGLAIFFNSSVALELSLNYDSSKFNSNVKSNNFIVGIGFQIHLVKK